jgi:membrane protein YdbS with pleckstrin-like domain
MVPQNAKARLTDVAAEEVRQDQYLEGRIEQRIRKWKRGTVWLGIALICCVVAVVPFVYGYPLHNYWDAVGKKILVLSMCLLPLFMFSAGITYMFWSYLRAIKNVHRRFVPPGSNS